MKIEKALKLRKKIKNKKPDFVRQEFHKRKKLSKKVWRKPKGSKSKLRLKKAHKKLVTPGYGSPNEVKGMHASGICGVRISNLKDIDNIKKNAGAVISGKVGTRKKIQLIEELLKRKISILNVKEPEKYIEKVKSEREERKKKKKKKEEKPKEKLTKKKEEKESIEDKLSEEEKKKVEKKEIDRLLTKKF